MNKSLQIQYISVQDLFLDPTNPRLGRRIANPALKQAEVLNAMRDWTLDELAESFLTSGFWPQEALIAVKEKIYGSEKLVVIEGNRRLAALKFLEQTKAGNPPTKAWKDMLAGSKVPKDLLESVPYILVESREKVASYLGFRHVTGIKVLTPTEN